MSVPWYVWGGAGGLLSGLGLCLVWITLTRPRARRGAAYVQTTGLQHRYRSARLLLSWNEFVTKGAVMGVGLFLLGLIASGNLITGFTLFWGGFVMTFSAAEEARDKFMMAYSRQLERAMASFRSAVRSRMSIDDGLKTAAMYASGPVAEDFGKILAARQANVSRDEAIIPIAEERQSLFLDGFFATIQAAEKIGGGDIGQVLEEQADTIREQISVFEDHLVHSASIRQEAMWALFVPWIIIALLRLLPYLMASLSGIPPDTAIGDFYASPVGISLLEASALITIYGYWSMTHIMRRGIILGRVPIRNRGQGV